MDAFPAAPTRIHCLRALPDEPGGEVSRRNGHTRNETTAAISTAIAQLLRARTGRGPTRVQTTMSSSLAIVTLGDYFTKVEDVLADSGHSELAAQVRTVLHEALRDEAVAAVEAVTGRHVTAYLTAHQQDPDLSILAFHLGLS